MPLRSIALIKAGLSCLRLQRLEEKHMPKRLRRFCRGFANPSLPRSPSAIFIFSVMVATPFCSKKIKKPPPHFSTVATAVYPEHKCHRKTACSLCAPCCCLAALAQPYELFLCEILAYSFAMPDHTKAAVCLRASWPPSPFRYAALLSRGRLFCPHPANQGRSGGAGQQ